VGRKGKALKRAGSNWKQLFKRKIVRKLHETAKKL